MNVRALAPLAPLAAALSALALTACEKPTTLDAEATVDGSEVEIVLGKATDKKGKLAFSGKAKAIDKLGSPDWDSGKLRLKARLKDFPVGKTEVSVAFEGEGIVKYKGKTTFEVTRPFDPVKLRFEPTLTTGLTVSCSSEWCKKTSTLHASPEGFVPLKGTDDEGCTVELAGEEHEIEGKTWKLDAWPTLADAPATLATTKNEYLTLPLDAKCGKEAATKRDLKLNGIEIAVATMRGIAGRPLKAKKEKGSAGKNIAFVETYSMRFIGKVEKLRDVDYIAKVDSVRTVVGSCTYGGASGTFDIDRAIYDETVHVYDRRTGKELDTKKFDANWPACPELAKRDDSAVGWPDEPAIDVWIKQVIDKK
jgi:hypothetical protein